MSLRKGGSLLSNSNPPKTYQDSEEAIAMKSKSPSSSSSASAIAEFDALRREATKLERHLEDRVAKYQQLAQRFTTGDTANNYNNQNSLLHDSSSNSSQQQQQQQSTKYSLEEEESLLSNEITRTISSMSDLVNNRMAPVAEKTNRSQHSLLVKRYREILFDCSADFKKTSAAVSRRRDAMELFAGRRGANSSEESSDMEHLLRERNAIGNSLNMTSQLVEQASEIRNDLRFQGSSLKGITGTVQRIAANVPGINGLVDAIKRKRSKDDMILSGVIALCILFTLWYIFG